MNTVKLPELPRPALPEGERLFDAAGVETAYADADLYTAAQMESYARAAVEASQPKPNYVGKGRLIADQMLHHFAPKAEAVEECPCKLPTCVESWEPGCGLGNSEEHAGVAAAQPSAAVTEAMVEAALPHLIGIVGSEVRPVGQFYSGQTADESEETNWRYYGRERVRRALTAALSKGGKP